MGQGSQHWRHLGLKLSQYLSAANYAKAPSVLDMASCSLDGFDQSRCVLVDSLCTAETAGRKCVYMLVERGDFWTDLLCDIVEDRCSVACEELRCSGSDG